MDKKEDPYISMVDTIKKAGREAAGSVSLKMYIGTVVNAEPLTVTVAGTRQIASSGNLYINPMLLTGDYVPVRLQSLSGTVSASTTDSEGDTTGSISFNGSGTVTGILYNDAFRFNEGDCLVMLSRDMQNFYIVCKEVPAV